MTMCLLDPSCVKVGKLCSTKKPCCPNLQCRSDREKRVCRKMKGTNEMLNCVYLFYYYN